MLFVWNLLLYNFKLLRLADFDRFCGCLELHLQHHSFGMSAMHNEIFSVERD